jgi:hypothetical protein
VVKMQCLSMLKEAVLIITTVILRVNNSFHLRCMR